MASLLDFVQTLLRAIKAIQLYSPGHPRHGESLAALEQAWEAFLQGRNQVQIGAMNGRLFIDKEMEDVDKLPVRSLAHLFEERGIRVLTLYPGVSRGELSSLLAVLMMKTGQLQALGGARKYLEDLQQATHFRIVTARLEDASDGGEAVSALLEAMARVGPGGGPGGGSVRHGASDSVTVTRASVPGPRSRRRVGLRD